MSVLPPLPTPQALADYCSNLLAKPEKDYCPNGLQVLTNDTPIKKIITGVSATQALIKHAIDAQADAILVHHGYFWRGENERLTGMKGARIGALYRHNINLLAYHLPLDIDPIFGNNILLLKALGLSPDGEFDIARIGTLNTPISANDFANHIKKVLQRAPLHLSGGAHTIRRVGICTGAAQDLLTKAHQAGCDAFISGEVSERTTHEALELGIHYFACGHHATETFGVRALGEHLAAHFGIQVQFINIDNPV